MNFQQEKLYLIYNACRLQLNKLNQVREAAV